MLRPNSYYVPSSASSNNNNNNSFTISNNNHVVTDNNNNNKTIMMKIKTILYSSIRRYCTIKRCIISFVISLIIIFYFIIYPLLWKFWLSGAMVSDMEKIIDRNGNNQVLIRRHPDRMKKMDSITKELIPKTPIDGIMEGYLTLIDIDISNQYGLKYYNQSNPYQNVSATFCHISWHQPKPQQNQNHKQQPKVKTFHDLISSPICQSTLYHVNDLYGDVIIPITLYDQEQLALSSQQQVIYVPPTVLIFHESNAGSTVLSNILNAFTAYHTETMRVYNEPYPLIKSLMGCDSIKTTGSLWGISCDTKSHMKLVQDIFYLLGRIPILISWPETHYIYYKMDAISSQYMNVFNAAMPSTSWIFLYRNSIEVLMSHFPHYYQLDQNHKTKIASIVTQYSYNNNNTNNDNTEQQYHDELNYYYRNHLKKPSNSKHKSLCLRYYGNMEQQPDILHEIVQQVDRTILSLSKEEYCAAYIATLVETAIRQHDDTTNASISSIPSTTTPRHWFINYNQLPYVIWEYILPQLLDGHRQITKEEREYMHYISTLYDTAKTSSSFTSSSSSLWSSLKTKTNNNNNKDNSNQHFVEDSIMKQNVAPPMIYDASQLFLDPIYNKMELIRQNQ